MKSTECVDVEKLFIESAPQTNIMLTIGIDLGGTNIKAALVDDEKGILHKFSFSTEADKGVDHIINKLVEAIKVAGAKAKGPISGVGVGSPGVISYDRTTVSNPPNFPGWTSVNLAAELKKRTFFDVYVDNDANLMALGSSYFGMGKTHANFIMVTLGTGVGGGIIYQNKLFRGATGGAGELGHVMIDYNGPASNSPTIGGIEAYLGQRFLSRLAWKRIQSEPQNPLFERYKSDPESMEPKDLTEQANLGNALAIDILRDAGEKLGYAIVNYIHILDIRKIIVSGGVALAGDWILKPAREAALTRMMVPYHNGFEIMAETLGNDAALLGAASLPYEYLPD